MRAMKEYAARHQVKLRPHAKMHKSAAIALKLMRDGGAVGACCQKVSEAEVLAQGGVHDLYISNEVIGLPKNIRVVALAHYLAEKPNGRLAIALDSEEGLSQLEEAWDLFAQDGAETPGAGQGTGKQPLLHVLVEVNVGHNRCGIDPSTASGKALIKELVQRLVHPDNTGKRGLRFGGLQAYHGSAQHIRSWSEKQSVIERAIQTAKSTAEFIQAELPGVQVPLVTGAGTGSFPLEATSGVYGELQAGSYLVMDQDYGYNETCHTGAASSATGAGQGEGRFSDVPVFQHALFLKSTVISASFPDRVVVDAGHKSSAIDSGLPTVFGYKEKGITYANGGDDHGVLRGAALEELKNSFGIGETVWLIPNHCDPTFNLHNFALAVRGGLSTGRVEEVYFMDARGCQW